MACLSILFAVVATQGYAIFALCVVGILSPAVVLAYIVFVRFREEVFGKRNEPLASSLRDPLGIEENARAMKSENVG